MHAPARITSARFGWRPVISRAAGVARPVELDLAFDLGGVEHRAVNGVGVVRREPVLHGGEVRDRAAHPDERVRRRPSSRARSAAIAASAADSVSSETAPPGRIVR